MTAYTGAIVDLDGTVWRGESLIDGAEKGLAALRETGVSTTFVTNSTALDRASFGERLAALGLSRDAGPVVTSAAATARFVAERYPDASVYAVGQGPVSDELERAGLDLDCDPNSDGEPADVLVAGRDPGLDEALLAGVLDAVTRDTAFVATNTDSTHPVEGGLRPGAGATIGAISGMLEREPVVVGKPSTRMAETATDLADASLTDPAEWLVIGDRVDTDISMGEKAGMTTVLVLTGASSEADVRSTGIEPDYVIESLGEIDRVLD